MKATIILVVLLTCVVPVFMKVKECRRPADCAPNECCVLGMNRYSIPRCEPLGEIGAHCLMGNDPEDKTLAYPNKVVDVFAVYRLFCPCKRQLRCKYAKCSVS